MSMELLEDRSGERDYALERLIMLSDGVFAIAITLLALELRPPEDWDHTLGGLWIGMWRPALAFLFSFVAIGAFWISHRRMFGRFHSADLPLTILNLLLLGLITLVPVATNLVYTGGPRGGGFTVYIGLLTLIGLSNALLWGYVAFVRPSLFRREPPRDVRVLVLMVMLVLPMMMPITGLVVAERLPAWSLAFLMVIVVGVRFLRSRIKGRIEPEWRP
ncbi:MAG: TMEM175 family protein [Brevundimonas sp.]